MWFNRNSVCPRLGSGDGHSGHNPGKGQHSTGRPVDTCLKVAGGDGVFLAVPPGVCPWASLLCSGIPLHAGSGGALEFVATSPHGLAMPAVARCLHTVMGHTGPVAGAWRSLGSRHGRLCSEGVGVRAERAPSQPFPGGQLRRGAARMSPRGTRGSLRPWGPGEQSDLGSEVDIPTPQTRGDARPPTPCAVSGGRTLPRQPDPPSQRGFKVQALQARSSKGQFHLRGAPWTQGRCPCLQGAPRVATSRPGPRVRRVPTGVREGLGGSQGRSLCGILFLIKPHGGP